MSTSEQQGHPGLTPLASSGAGSIPLQRKKRHHSNAAAAIAARRSGQLGPGMPAEEDGDQGAPFVSSSRDASEVSLRCAKKCAVACSDPLLFTRRTTTTPLASPTRPLLYASIRTPALHRRTCPLRQGIEHWSTPRKHTEGLLIRLLTRHLLVALLLAITLVLSARKST
jgi:hypothetical protein